MDKCFLLIHMKAPKPYRTAPLVTPAPRTINDPAVVGFSSYRQQRGPQYQPPARAASLTDLPASSTPTSIPATPTSPGTLPRVFLRRTDSFSNYKERSSPGAPPPASTAEPLRRTESCSTFRRGAESNQV